MTSDGSSREPTLEQRIHMTDSFGKFIHNASIAMLVGAPILIALPPRKLDLYTFSLTGAWIASANQLVKERTGASVIYQLPGVRLPVAAQEYQERLRAREQGKRLLDEDVPLSSRPTIRETLEKHGSTSQHNGPTSELGKAAKDLWMGGEKDGWKERRLAEEQKKLDEGEGYADMIVDQIWEVWNWGDKKTKDQEHNEQRNEQIVADARRVIRAEQNEPKEEYKSPTIEQNR